MTEKLGMDFDKFFVDRFVMMQRRSDYISVSISSFFWTHDVCSLEDTV